MNRPMGCVYLRPFGAVRSTERLDIMVGDGWKSLLGGLWESGEGAWRRHRRDLRERKRGVRLAIYIREDRYTGSSQPAMKRNCNGVDL